MRPAPSATARARALAVLALVHVARGDVASALSASADALDLAERAGVESGESLVYSARASALAAAGAPNAATVRELGRRRLLDRAAAIADPSLRASFLNVPENANLLASP